MNKYISIIFVFLFLFMGFFWYSEYKKVDDFKKEVVDYLNNKGFTTEEYSTPKYVKEEVMKGLKVAMIEIIFNEESNCIYSYGRTSDGIEFFYAINEDTGERDYDKEEPIK
ncbi:hypothetical protein A8F94_14785 [Bacillus sp. FJAT-27225]|uniref:hypothetical protein n=1 Tax=Bacillus sp. FJAT-27225 TaxID=1743144 RepID=UPI00080C25DD|nr:hypothetical protein [Bacillus sp. FJAT-27225]OCA84000.1 hypothetical protein A8F94_14785 [Bacillus sp. FJAT-27225]